MTVKELIKQLKRLPQNHTVVLSRDQEGNGYEELRVLDVMIFRPGDYGQGEVYTEEDLEELEDERQPDDVDAVVLWP